MITAQVVETSVIVNKSPFQDYDQLDDNAQPILLIKWLLGSNLSRYACKLHAIKNTELTVKDKSFSKRKWSQKDHQIPQRTMECILWVFFETKLICRVICQVEVNILSTIMLFSCRRTIQVQPSYTGRAIPDKHHVCPDLCMDVSTI